jgi:hypothetical protein
VIVSNDLVLDGQDIWVSELIEKLQSGEILRHENGIYQWKDRQPPAFGVIHCKRCRDVELDDDFTKFESIGRVGGDAYHRGLSLPDRPYHHFFKHNELEPDGPCWEPIAGQDIRPIRYQPYIPTAGANQFNLVTDVIRPAGIDDDDDDWMDLVAEIETARGGLLGNDGQQQARYRGV